MIKSTTKTATIGEIITAKCASVAYICISCTYYSGRLEYYSRFVGPGGWGGRHSERKIVCKSVDDNCDGFSVYSVVQMERGSTFGIITDDSETL